MKTEKKKRFFTLILPLCALLLFVALFVGSGIHRLTIRKELTEMGTASGNRSDNGARLSRLEEQNKRLDYILGRDEKTEKLFEEVR